MYLHGNRIMRLKLCESTRRDRSEQYDNLMGQDIQLSAIDSIKNFKLTRKNCFN